MQRKQNGITTIINWKYSILVLTLAALLLSGCKSRAVEEAREVIAVADSLRAEGQGYTDSVVIAEAYNTLDKWQYIYPTDYVHACYHYGRLLRNNDDPVAAMQVFINATHSSSMDYHILGRIYSNMANMCRLGDYHDDAYKIYQFSSEMFSRAGDSLLYYYALNNMAFEKAELGKKEEALSILDSITSGCHNTAILTKTWETRAEIYRMVSQYDSAIYCAHVLQSQGNMEPTGTLILAQSFSMLEMHDSALHFANIVLADSQASYQNIFNALYIISHNDSTLSNNSIRDIASHREDIRYYDYEPLKEKLTRAVQILQQDLTRTPNIMWLYAIIGTLVAVGIVATIYVERKRRRRQLLSQQISDLENMNKETIDDMLVQLENRCAMFKSSTNLKEDLCWNNYEELCAIINQQFFHFATKLQKTQVLTESEIRLCFLILIGLNRQQISEIFPYAVNGIGKFKYRVANKLGIEGKNLRNFLINMAIGN